MARIRQGFQHLEDQQASLALRDDLRNDQDDQPPQENSSSLFRRSISLSSILRTLGFQNSGYTQDPNDSSSKGGMNSRSQGLSLLSVPYGVAPKAPTPRFKKHKSPVELPLKSTFLDYSREYFQEPQMKRQESDEPGSVEYTSKLWRRNRNESIIQNTQHEKELSLYGDWSNKIATLDNKTQPKLLRFTQFESFVVSSDDRDNITVFDWEEERKLAFEFL